MPNITELWAWVAHEGEDMEGIIAVEMDGPGRRTMMVPLIGADRERIVSLEAEAQTQCNRAGITVTLRRFTTMTTLQTLTPESQDKDNGPPNSD